MIAAGRHRHGSEMPCESCAVQFSVFKRKRACCECERYYCSGCLRRGGGSMCAPCRALCTRPLYRNTIAHLKVRDLQCFLQRQNVSTRGCVEKEELVSLCVSHVNGASYRRRGGGGARPGGGAFSSLKGLTSNINDFINNAFDLRPAPQPQTQPQPQPHPPSEHTNQNHARDCYNSSHVHRAPSPENSNLPSRPRSERFTTTPGGERDIEVPVPVAERTPSLESTHVETADCFEIEDLDDAGWEFVTRPAEPLPNDSEVLISTADALRRDQQHTEQVSEMRQAARRATDSRESAESAPPTDATQLADSRQATSRLSAESRLSAQSDFETIPRQPSERADNPRPTISRDYLTPGLSGGSAGLAGGAGAGLSASALELRGERASSPDTTSLKDELATQSDSSPASPRAGPARISLEEVSDPAVLETLTVKQLKELLARNRVEYRGCVERRELVERAQRLWRERAAAGRGDELSIEDSCKICMAAPLECVLLECGHIAACTRCATQLAECPICRQYVVRAVRFFRS